MKKSLALIIAVVALLVLALPMVSAQSGTPETTPQPASPNVLATLTFTQAEINNSFWVNNPPDPHLTDVLVDLQSANGGRVVITAVYTWRDIHNSLTSVILRVVTVPEIVNGHVIWIVTEATSNGRPVTPAERSEINLHLIAAWRHWVGNHLPNAYFTNVAITDDTITFAFHPHI